MVYDEAAGTCTLILDGTEYDVSTDACEAVAAGENYQAVTEAGIVQILVTDTPSVPGPPADPVTKDDCKKGGWEAYGFTNQGQCIQFVNTGKDSRS